MTSLQQVKLLADAIYRQAERVPWTDIAMSNSPSISDNTLCAVRTTVWHRKRWKPVGKLCILPCLDSEQVAASRREELSIPRELAAALGYSAVEAAREGFYTTKCGHEVHWREAVEATCAAKVSIPPDAELPSNQQIVFSETAVQVTNETTLGASLRLVERGLRPLALNFANGVHPGGGFLDGARAQEEVLCRSSALWQTLIGDPMYDDHRKWH